MRRSIFGGAPGLVLLAGMYSGCGPAEPAGGERTGVVRSELVSGCVPQIESNCSVFGCGCLNNQCAGGNCPSLSDGCSSQVRSNCAVYGCGCSNDTCYGGNCPMPGKIVRNPSASEQ